VNHPRDKAIDREPGEDKARNPSEEAGRIEDDARANKGLGGIVQPQEESETEDALERAARRS
jgi:hypothetical protein